MINRVYWWFSTRAPVWMVRLHVRAYRLTGGRAGGRHRRFRYLLLTTTGRRSGKARTTPLTFLDDDGAFVVSAANGGRDAHPQWLLNLRAHPDALVQVGARRMAVRADVLTDEERESQWARFVELNPLFERYRSITRRSIELVRLRP